MRRLLQRAEGLHRSAFQRADAWIRQLVAWGDSLEARVRSAVRGEDTGAVDARSPKSWSRRRTGQNETEQSQL